MDLNAGVNNQHIETNQIGANLKIDVTENLHFDIDASYAKSKSNPDANHRNDGANIGYGGTLGTTLGVRVLGDSSDTLPQLTTFGPNGDTSRYLDPSIIGSHVLVRTQQQNTDTIKQARFTTTYEQEGMRLDVGAAYLDDNFTLQNRNTFANNFWQAYSGYGTPSGRTSGVLIPESMYRGTIGTGGFIPGFSGGGALPPSLLVYSPYDLYNFLEGLGNPWAQQIDGFNYPGGNLANGLLECAEPNPPQLCAYRGSLDLALDPGSIQDITEKTFSAFIRANFTAEIGDMPFHFSAGLRNERTDVTSSGQGRLPILLTQSDADPTLLTTSFSETQPITTKSDYSYLLPSLSTKLEVTPDVHLRF